MYSSMPTRRLPQAIPHMSLMGLGAGAPDPISMGVSAGMSLANNAMSSWLQDKKEAARSRTFSTTIVNELEPLLNKNKNAYLAGPGSCADQATALSAFDSAWQWLQSAQACGNPQLGAAGQNCVGDRAPGGRWDWTAMYRDPIANDSRPVCGYSEDAEGQAAAANIFSKLSGSNYQTNAGMVPSYSGGSGAGAVQSADPLNLGTIGGIPMTYILLGVGAIVLVAVIA